MIEPHPSGLIILSPRGSAIPIRDDSNFTSSEDPQCTFHNWSHLPNPPSFFKIFTIVSVLTVIVVLVVLGNTLVIAAVILRRRLRSATGLLILSLAVADLMVGLAILPFSIANEALDTYWIFGDTWCKMWVTLDIWMCTASIYNLVAISIDRYIAIIKPLNYPMIVTKSRARLIVVAVWVGSFIICSPSFLLASTDTTKAKDCKCTPANSGIAYIVFSASSSFYIPMIVVIFVYVRIYIAACAATKSVYSGMMQVTSAANKNPKNILMQNPSALSRPTMPMLRVHRGSGAKVPANNSTTTGVNGINNNGVNGATAIGRNNSIRVSRGVAPMNATTTNLSVNRYPRVTSRCQSEDRSPTTGMSNGDAAKDQLQRTNGSIPTNGGSPNPSLRSLQINSIDLPSARGSLDRQTSVASDKSSRSKSPGLEQIKEHPTGHCKLTLTKNGSDEYKKVLVQSDSVASDESKQKKPAGVYMLSKIIRRGPKKRAGCAYEKRLSLEIKAAKTVAIVTGCFIFCWLGFSILYLLSGLTIEANKVIWSIVFWLGYLNSALNPVIYTVFNREFRTCFTRLLTCNYFWINNVSTTQHTMYNSYNSQQIRPVYKNLGNSIASAPPTNYSRCNSYTVGQQPLLSTESKA